MSKDCDYSQEERSTFAGGLASLCQFEGASSADQFFTDTIKAICSRCVQRAGRRLNRYAISKVHSAEPLCFLCGHSIDDTRGCLGRGAEEGPSHRPCQGAVPQRKVTPEVGVHHPRCHRG